VGVFHNPAGATEGFRAGENTPDPDLWKSRVQPPAPKPLRAVFVYYTETKTALVTA
jgi:hypothetical protein